MGEDSIGYPDLIAGCNRAFIIVQASGPQKYRSATACAKGSIYPLCLAYLLLQQTATRRGDS